MKTVKICQKRLECLAVCAAFKNKHLAISDTKKPNLAEKANTGVLTLGVRGSALTRTGEEFRLLPVQNIYRNKRNINPFVCSLIKARVFSVCSDTK